MRIPDPRGNGLRCGQSGGRGVCAEIRVRVRAAITENAGLGTSIPCVASIGYLNAAGIFYEAQSEAGEVHTGGIHLFVSDEAGQPLSGGTFRLAGRGDLLTTKARF